MHTEPKMTEPKIKPMALQDRPSWSAHHAFGIRPAERWQDALVMGNGTLRVQAFGHPYRERLYVGHERMYVPQWRAAPEPPDIAGVLPEVKRLLLAGEYEAASMLAVEEAKKRGGSDVGFSELHNAAAIQLELEGREAAEDYLHALDMASGETRLVWRDDRGAWLRSGFVSRADGAIVQRLVPPDGAAAELTLRLSPYAETDHERDPLRWLDAGPDGQPAFAVRQAAPDTVAAEASYRPHAGRAGYAVATRVAVPEGAVIEAVEAADGGLKVRFRGEVMLLTVVVLTDTATSDAADEAVRTLAELEFGYEELLTRHMRLHTPLFMRSSIDLGGGEERRLSVEELLAVQLERPCLVPALLEKLFDMGRYFLISYTGELPPLYGHVNINTNLQLSFGNTGGLKELMHVYFRWVESMLEDSRINARRLLGTRGFQFAAHPDAESGLLYHFFKDYPHHYWLSGSGWVLQPYLEYYETTLDAEFLHGRMLPLYAELAELYEDLLTERDAGGRVVFVPSYSPENKPAGFGSPLAINAVMDISVCKEVLGTLLRYGGEDAFGTERAARWRELLDAMPAYATGPHGELKEWAWEGLGDRLDHRHVSHLYGAWPGLEFDRESEPALHRAARIANRKRALEDQSAHGIAHRALVAARVGDRELVQRHLALLLETGFVNYSLMTNHYPYRFNFPDAIGAIPTILAEAALYSTTDRLELLPAMPPELAEGALSGLRTRAGIVVDRLAWRLPAGEIDLCGTPLRDGAIRLLCGRPIRSLELEGDGASVDIRSDGFTIRFGRERSFRIAIQLGE
ncbi:glycoside hydrolase N-terminal domain-containing protein [Cohnella sp. GCM10020058]|uniref:glycosyl hydrolase family 95 catalytic domain-containing protein n=1 Tax=Cohnella sp. GCM10020058 TaxID=3317330 RepID=UPI0036329A48